MTIGDRIKRDQPEVWIRLVIDYDLQDKYLPSYNRNQNIDLMKLGTYSGKVQRRHGSIIQAHRIVIK